MTNEIEKKLQVRDARCCEGNSKECSDNISNIKQLLNMATCNTASLELEFNDIVLQEQDTRYNVLNFKEQKKVKLREGSFLQNQLKKNIKAINDNKIHNNKTVVNDIY